MTVTVDGPAVFDLHDAALPVWRACGAAWPLVHLDAHLDAEPYEPGALHIGNVVRAAARERICSRIVWIVPDPVWASPSSRAVVNRELARAAGDAASIEGVPVALTTIDHLPPIDEPVLLDVDVDYLFYAERVDGDDRPGDLPWIWPDALVARLRHLAPRSVTIASSVTGGFTPLRWKHLAPELALRIGGCAESVELDAWGRLAAVARAPAANRIAGLRAVADDHPRNAAVLLHLAEALQSAGCLDEACAVFARAVSLDGEYRHLYRTAAPLDQAQGDYARARREYERALALDPLDPFSRIGLAQIAEDEGHLDVALRLFEEALALPRGDQIEACRGAARLLEERDPARALAAYERSLKLALTGRAPLSAMPASHLDGTVTDPGHADTYRRMARLHARAGRVEEARTCEQLASAIDPSPSRP